MPRILAISTANPKNKVTQDEVKAFTQSLFLNDRRFKHLLPVYENANVLTRYFSANTDWFGQTHSFTEVNDFYIEVALSLSEEVTLDVAKKCEISTEDFDVVFFVSTTGLSTPSLDARLFNKIRMNPHIKRVPIWGLGCAGGAGGIARAFDYLKAFPKHRVLIITVELCSLAFQKTDLSTTNVISTAIFGDGAAACVIYGDEVPIPLSMKKNSPSILSSLSTIYPDTLDVMSWRITSDGFKVNLSKDIPTIVTSLVKQNIDDFLKENEIRDEQISHYVFHPGGMKVLQAYAQGLGVSLEKFSHAVDILQNFGNMSSVTVYFILKKFMDSDETKTDDYGLIGALGPGFSSELVLLRF